VDAPLCPRRGFAVVFWTAGHLPFCAECGWNFEDVCESFRKNSRHAAWIVGALPFLVGVRLLGHRANWSAALILFGIAGAVVALVASTRSRQNRRMEALRDAIERKPGSDLSSKSPAELPARAATFGESLRSLPRPRPVRLVTQARAAIWMVRVIPLFLAYWALHDLIFPMRPIGMMSGPGISTILLLLSLFVWFLAPRSLKRESHLPLLAAGEVAMVRATTSSRRFPGAGIRFQFRVEGQGANHTEYRLDGTYIPVFYDAQNPANYVPSCALNYELALPKEAATAAGLSRTEPS
jgi:hypothetical protein